MNLRAFIAIDLPDQLQDALEKQITRLRQPLGDELVRWVPTQNMHLTLKFLGTISASHLEFLKQLITQTVESHAPFDMQINGIGSFPNSKQARILWAGIHAPAELSSLQKSLEAGTTRLGYEAEERPFSPHLTLGRVRQNIDQTGMQKIRTTLASIQLGNIGSARVDSIHLYKSELHSNGSVYTKLFSATLKKHN
ncbi:MAG: RNA 2',3'-cyclic phosphodiesterase [Anaerolineales bacterium]